MGEKEYKNINKLIYNGKQKFLDENLGKNDKKRMIHYVIGNEILEIGCGSGVNLDMIEKTFPTANVRGIDISEKVIETLELKKQIQHKKWNAILGNGLYLNQFVENDSLDTIIFCSVIHELFSYVEWQNKKFNYNTVKTVLQNAYKALKVGGRIIIRDGIKTENNDIIRKIVFNNKESFNFLKQYCKDFKGRDITFKDISNNKECAVEMKVNDCMEFLYTLTWGYDSYKYEVQEQYGYFSPIEYDKFIKELFGNKIKILELSTYLQNGYIKSLKGSISLFDSENNPVSLPDSNCLIVIEKIN